MKEKQNKLNKFKTKKMLFTTGVVAATTIGISIPLAVTAQNKTINNTTIEEQYRNNLEGHVSLRSTSHDSPELSNAKRKAIYILDKFIYFSIMFDKPNPGESKTRDIVLLNAKNAIWHASNIGEVRSLTTKAKTDWTFALVTDNAANHQPSHGGKLDFLNPVRHEKKELPEEHLHVTLPAPIPLESTRIKAKLTLENFVKRLQKLPIDEVSKHDIRQKTISFRESIEKADSISLINYKLNTAMIIIREVYERAAQSYALKQEELKNKELHAVRLEQTRINRLIVKTPVNTHRFRGGAPLSGKLNIRFAKRVFGIDINRIANGRDYLINYLRYHGQVVRDDDSWQKLTIPSFSLYIDGMQFFFPVGSYFYVNNHGHDKQVMMSKVVGVKKGPSSIYFDHLYDRLTLKGPYHFTYTYEVTNIGIKITAHSFAKPDLTIGIEPIEIPLGSYWEDDVFKIKELYKRQEAINNIISSKSSVAISNVLNPHENMPFSREMATKLGLSNIFKRNPLHVGKDDSHSATFLISKYKNAHHYYQLLPQLNSNGNKFIKTYKKQFFNENTWLSYNGQNIVMLKNNKDYYLEFLGDTRIKFSFILNGKPFSYVWLASSMFIHSFRLSIDNDVDSVDSVQKLKESFIAQGQPVDDGHDRQKLITDVITYDFIDNHVIANVHKIGSYFQFGDTHSENNVFIGTEVNSIDSMLSHKYAHYFTGNIPLGVPKFVYTYNLANNGNISIKVHRFDKKIISPAKVKEIVLPISFKKEKNDALITLDELVAKIRLYSLLDTPKKIADEILAIHKYSIFHSDSISEINRELASAIQRIKLLMNRSTIEALNIHQTRINHLISTKRIELPIKVSAISQVLNAKTAKKKFGIDLDTNNTNNLEQGVMRDSIIKRLEFLGQKVKNDDSWQTLAVNASVYFESIKKIIHFPIGTKFYINNHGSDKLVGFGNSNFKLRLANGQSTITSVGIHPLITVHSVHFKYTYKVDSNKKGVVITVHFFDQPEVNSVVKPTSIIIA